MTAQGVYRRDSASPIVGPGSPIVGPASPIEGEGTAPEIDPEFEDEVQPVPALVVVGSVSRDIVADDERGWRLGGAVTYGSLTAARLGVRVGCLLGVDDVAADCDELHLLRAAGVDVVPVRLDTVPVLENIEAAERRTQRWIAKGDAIPPTALPAAWRHAPAWMLAPIAGELPASWAEVPEERALVGVGWQGLLREFLDDGTVHGVRPGADPLLARAALVCASVDDLPGDCNLAAVREVLAPGATLVATAGSRGGFVLRGRQASSYQAIPADVVDPTGAGDVFLAALMAGWLTGDRPAGPRSLRLAAAAASCAVERPGIYGVPDRAAVVARLRRG